MVKTKHLLSAGLLAVGLTGFVMPSQWGYAAEPAANPARATPEMMQLLRDEHDLVAEMIWGSSPRNETDTRSKERPSAPHPTRGRVIPPGRPCMAAVIAEEMSRC